MIPVLITFEKYIEKVIPPFGAQYYEIFIAYPNDYNYTQELIFYKEENNKMYFYYKKTDKFDNIKYLELVLKEGWKECSVNKEKLSKI